MRLPICIFAGVLTLCFSCTPQYEKNKIEALDLHDVSMERMTELKNTMRAVQKDTLLEGRAQLLSSLKNAEDDMWTWMYTYKEADENWSSEQKNSHYKDILQDMHRVDSQIVHSIKNAKDALQK